MKKAFSLIEMALSLFIFSLVFMSVSRLMRVTSLELNFRGKAYHDLNQAYAEIIAYEQKVLLGEKVIKFKLKKIADIDYLEIKNLGMVPVIKE